MVNKSTLYFIRTSLVAQMAKHLPTMWETWVQSLGPEDPLEKEMVIHSSTLAWKIPWREECGRLQSTRSQRVRHDWKTSLSLLLSLANSFFLSLSTSWTNEAESEREPLLVFCEPQGFLLSVYCRKVWPREVVVAIVWNCSMMMVRNGQGYMTFQVLLQRTNGQKNIQNQNLCLGSQ